MGELLAVSSGIAGLLSLAIDVGELSSRYINSAKHARTDGRMYLAELQDLDIIFHQLEQHINTWPSISGNPPVEFTAFKKLGFQDCSTRLAGIKKSLEPFQGRSSLGRRLAWPFKEPDTRKVIEDLQRYRGMLNDALSREATSKLLSGTKRAADASEESLQELREVKRQQLTATDAMRRHAADSGEMRNGINELQTRTALLQQASEALGEEQTYASKRAFLDWLSVLDASIMHNSSRKSHVAGTGQWFLGSARFITWQSSASQLLWLHGGPGTGKTVLVSTVLHHMLQTLDDPILTAFWYFDFNDCRTLTLEAFVRAILRQIAASTDSIPLELRKGHQQYSDRCQQPGTGDLLEMFRILMTRHSRLNIVVDALDECVERMEVIDLLGQLLDRYSNGLRVLLTSRRIPDIETRLEQIDAAQFSTFELGKELTAADIDAYIRSRLATDPGLRRRTADDKSLIQRELSAGANGMFKWVECQVRSLAECRTSGALKKSLRSLPPTLRASYLRTVEEMTETDRELLMSSFKFLMFAQRSLSLEELAEAAVLTPNRCLDEDSRLFEARIILNTASGLLKEQPSNRLGYPNQMDVKLAHFSVQEWLYSALLSDQPFLSSRKEKLAQSWISEDHVHRDIALMCVGYLQACQQDIKSNAFELYPFIAYAGRYWTFHASRAFQALPDDCSELTKQVVQLLDSSAPAYLTWLKVWLPDEPFGNLFSGYRKLSTKGVRGPLYYACRFGFDAVLKCLLTSDRAFTNVDWEDCFARAWADENISILHLLGTRRPLLWTSLPMPLRDCANHVVAKHLKTLLQDPDGDEAVSRDLKSQALYIFAMLWSANLNMTQSELGNGTMPAEQPLPFAEDRKGSMPLVLPDVIIKIISGLQNFRDALSITADFCTPIYGLFLYAIHVGGLSTLCTILVSDSDLQHDTPCNIRIRQWLLQQSIKEGLPLFVELSIKHGADPCPTVNEDGLELSPLYLAFLANHMAGFQRRNVQKALLRSGVNLSTTRSFHCDSLNEGNMLQHAVLLSEGSSPLYSCIAPLYTDSQAWYAVHDLLESGLTPNDMTEVWQGLWSNACHFAIVRSRIELAQILIDDDHTSVDATLRSTCAASAIFEQTTLLDLAVLQGLSPIVEQLLAKGARVDSKSRIAALHVCSTKGDLEIGVKLLMAGANVDQNGKHGTCLYQAQHEGQWQMATLLRLFGAKAIPTVAAVVADDEQAFFDRCLQLNNTDLSDNHRDSIVTNPQEQEQEQEDQARGRSAPDTTISTQQMSRSQSEYRRSHQRRILRQRASSAPPCIPAAASHSATGLDAERVCCERNMDSQSQSYPPMEAESHLSTKLSTDDSDYLHARPTGHDAADDDDQIAAGSDSDSDASSQPEPQLRFADVFLSSIDPTPSIDMYWPTPEAPFASTASQNNDARAQLLAVPQPPPLLLESSMPADLRKECAAAAEVLCGGR
ncbi:uncharacterized protein HMPREF1541_10380 [Cyphellophora europaea CBS 101466]|uniref:Nephrocystin 3-like N-terminal domain-containing protein n=1 Tax=Cyphellophora europaea (strain CBS 101466) TaxID=1220924 RepID=W2S7V1_CYPE1|nr:uncharacterized protein HMPREF1541_10380 [Cyphellophora europaea CBS 101466]ETN44710.1 hypothetical protein HMPREF1541_10380 [Cyphellophora europaea CBS 101466]